MREHADFIPIDQTVAEVWPFSTLQDGRRVPSWMFKISKF